MQSLCDDIVSYGLRTTSEPATEPVTTAEVKSSLRIDFSDDDTDLGYMITAARRYIEEAYDKTLVTTTRAFYIDRFPIANENGKGWCLNGAVILPRPPVSSIVITYVDTNGDTQTWSSTLYQLLTKYDPCQIRPAYGQSYPTTRGQGQAVTLTYVCGFGAAAAVPAEYKRAVTILTGQLYRHREPEITGTIISEVSFQLRSLLGICDTAWVW